MMPDDNNISQEDMQPQPQPVPLISRTNARCWVMLDSDGNITAVADTEFPASDGGSVEVWAMSAGDYIARFVVVPEATDVVASDGGTVSVTVRCPSHAGGSIEVDVNGSVIDVALDNDGAGVLTLSADTADITTETAYVIRPADTITFAPVGRGTATVLVRPAPTQ